jgi:hypothetical protein
MEWYAGDAGKFWLYTDEGRIRNPRLIKSARNSSVWNLEDCLNIFFKKGKTWTGRPENIPQNILYYLPVENPTITATVVYIESGEYVKGGPAKDVNGRYLPGLVEFANVEKTLSVQALRAAGIETIWNQDDREEFVFTAQHVYKYDPNTGLSLGWKIDSPGGGAIVWQDEEELFNTSSSQFLPEESMD